MPQDIDLSQLQDLLESGTSQLVEVLPESEYTEEHLPGAINIPLKSLNEGAVARLDRSRPVVVYCWDDL